MKNIIIASLFFMSAALAVNAQTPIYQDRSKPIEQRIEDALGRMTLNEKIAVIHAQSKFYSLFYWF